MNNLSSLRWQRLELPHGRIVYVLPPRPFNWTQFAKAGKWVGGGMFLTLLAGWMLTLALLSLILDWSVSAVIWSVFLGALFLVGLSLVFRGLTALPFARLQIEVRRDCLCASSRLGFLTRTRSLQLAGVRALQIEPGELSRVLPYTQPILVYRLSAAGAGGALLLAEGFPVVWLEELAADLRGQLRVVEAADGMVKRLPEIPLEIRSDQLGATPNLQPSCSRAQLDWSDKGMSLVVPPLGVANELSGLWIIIVVMAALAIGPTTSICTGTMPPYLLVIPLGLACLALFCVWIFLRVVYCTTQITVRSDGLHLVRKHLRRFDERHWSLNEIEDVQLGPSRLPVSKGSPALPQLELRMRTSPNVSLLAGYPRAELQWIAHVVQEALTRQPRPPEPGLADILAQVPGERLGVRRVGDGVVVSCPALGVPVKMVVYILFGLLLLAGGGIGIALLVPLVTFTEVPSIATIAGWGFSLLGVFLGLVALVEAFTDAGRTRVFHVEPERLRIVENTVWGESERAWSRSEMNSIDVGPFVGALDAFIPLAGVRLNLQSNRQIAVGMWHRTEEIRWLGRLLRHVLRVSPPPRPQA